MQIVHQLKKSKTPNIVEADRIGGKYGQKYNFRKAFKVSVVVSKQASNFI